MVIKENVSQLNAVCFLNALIYAAEYGKFHYSQLHERYTEIIPT